MKPKDRFSRDEYQLFIRIAPVVMLWDQHGVLSQHLLKALSRRMSDVCLDLLRSSSLIVLLKLLPIYVERKRRFEMVFLARRQDSSRDLLFVDQVGLIYD